MYRYKVYRIPIYLSISASLFSLSLCLSEKRQKQLNSCLQQLQQKVRRVLRFGKITAQLFPIPVAWTSSDEAKRPNGRRCLESLRRVKSLGWDVNPNLNQVKASWHMWIHLDTFGLYNNSRCYTEDILRRASKRCIVIGCHGILQTRKVARSRWRSSACQKAAWRHPSMNHHEPTTSGRFFW